ncbi:Predicted membrane protein [uncultured Clostridium sp.]|uniref:LiaF transmembrane domain-containing protein n=1 Tax=uncultured Clostridium sp. TaxID=59620 RepID=UPI0008230F71|nr:LiaF domain-containing protein [uncultured Clostridium sp.]SCI90406.1 Predicted membrane protein [uncultured Clostridium sp.]
MKKERVFWGIFLLVGAVFLLVSKLGYFSDINIFSLLFTILLVGILVKSVIRLSFPGILFPLAFIGIIYDDKLGITAITPWTILLAALLGSIGLSLIFNRRPKWTKVNYSWDGENTETIDIEDEGHIKLETSFGSSIKYINTDKFEYANLECSFGNMKVYFDNAIMAKENAVVKIDVSFAGMQIYVPRGWNLVNNTSVSFGAVEEKNKRDSVITNTLTIIGDVSFSGVEIFYI